MFSRKITLLASAILLSSAALSHAADFPQPLGASAPGAAAQREIRIGPMTRYVNVERAETVRFVTAQGAFTWTFDTAPGRTVFDFDQIAPPAFAGSGIRVYVGEPAGDR